jgi:hypothetical protein
MIKLSNSAVFAFPFDPEQPPAFRRSVFPAGSLPILISRALKMKKL